MDVGEMVYPSVHCPKRVLCSDAISQGGGREGSRVSAAAALADDHVRKRGLHEVVIVVKEPDVQRLRVCGLAGGGLAVLAAPAAAALSSPTSSVVSGGGAG